ncbi:hypothetical protein ABK040_006304 [Willaertia magna]
MPRKKSKASSSEDEIERIKVKKEESPQLANYQMEKVMPFISQRDFDDIEREFRCCICMDVWTDPCAAHCSHIFCRKCIEQGIKHKKECPLCKLPICTRRDLMTMQSLTNLVESFQIFKRKFERAIELSNSNSNQVTSQAFDNSQTNGYSHEQLNEMFPEPIKEEPKDDEEMLVNNKKKSKIRSSSRNNLYNSENSSSKPPRKALGGKKKARKRKQRSTPSSSSSERRESDTESDVTVVVNIDEEEDEMSQNMRIIDEATDRLMQRPVPDQVEFIEEGVDSKRRKYSLFEEHLKCIEEHVNSPTCMYCLNNELYNLVYKYIPTLNNAPSIGSATELNTQQGEILLTKATPVQSKEKTVKKSPKGRKKIVFCSSCVEGPQKKKMERAAKIIGATIESDFNENVTHLITLLDDNRYARRTLKYCIGIVCGAWIVGMEWIEEILKNNDWIDEEPFSAIGDPNSVVNAPIEARKKGQKNGIGLFKDIRVFFYGQFKKSKNNPPKEDLFRLITFGGGKVLDALPAKKLKSSSRKCPYQNVVVVDSEITKDQVKFIEKESGTRPVVVRWLLDCVSNLSILENDNYFPKFEKNK